MHTKQGRLHAALVQRMSSAKFVRLLSQKAGTRIILKAIN